MAARGRPGDRGVSERTVYEPRVALRRIRSEEGGFDTTPSAGDRLRAGDTLIVLGTREQITRLGGLMRGGEVREDA